MRKLLHWLSQDDVARTNAAQASVRLQHRRHDRDDIDTYLAAYARDHESASGRGLPTSRQSPTIATYTADRAPRATSMVSGPGEPPDAQPPPQWAADQAASELYDVDDPVVIADRARQLARAAQEREDERHDEYDDPDQGGEA